MRHHSPPAAVLLIFFASICFGADANTQPQNLLLNGDAEQGKNGQPSVWFMAHVPADGLKMQQDTTQAKSGKSSLMIANTHKYDQPVANNWGQTLQDVPVGKTLLVSAAMKTSDVESANVCLQCWDASGERMLAFVSTPVVRGDQDWRTLKSPPVTVPAETKSIIVRAALGGTGTVWFDDLAVTESAAPATTPAAAGDRPAELDKLVQRKVVARLPIERDQMVLAYMPDWKHGNVDNIAIANNQGGVRTFFGWGEIDPKFSGKKFVLAVYSRNTRANKEPSPIEAYEVLADWDEQTPWTKQPRVAPRPLASFKYQPGNGWKTFDLTPLIETQMKAGKKSNGVLLRFAQEDVPVADHAGYTCVSREGEGGWEDRRPVLVVVE